MRSSMVHLLAECRRVFVSADEPIVDAPLSLSFDREVAILDAIRPAIRAGTRIEMTQTTLDETESMRTHSRGWPYLPVDEPWPRCPRCDQRLPCFLQLDMRDMLHRPPPAHRLFVVYRCSNCNDRGVVVRHYDTKDALALPLDESVPRDEATSYAIEMLALAHTLPREQYIERYHPDVIEQLSAIDPNWGRLYWFAEKAMGMGSLRIADHFGGWHSGVRTTSEVPCHLCGSHVILVSSTDWGDWVHSLWACPTHPDVWHFEFHK